MDVLGMMASYESLKEVTKHITALVAMLVDKKIITVDEWQEYLKMAENELDRQEKEKLGDLEKQREFLKNLGLFK